MPCRNNGTCIDGVNSYNCRCAAGFKGALCETEINECVELSPCANNATCVDLVADYRCICEDVSSAAEKTQYGGRNCSIALTGCHGNTCANGAACRPLLIDERTNNQSYACDCMSGYYGEHCEIDTAVTFQNNEAWIKIVDAVSAGMVNIGLQFRTTVAGNSSFQRLVDLSIL